MCQSETLFQPTHTDPFSVGPRHMHFSARRHMFLVFCSNSLTCISLVSPLKLIMGLMLQTLFAVDVEDRDAVMMVWLKV